MLSQFAGIESIGETTQDKAFLGWRIVDVMGSDIPVADIVTMHITHTFDQLEAENLKVFFWPGLFGHFPVTDQLVQGCVTVIANDDQTFIVGVLVNTRLDNVCILIDKPEPIVLLLQNFVESSNFIQALFECLILVAVKGDNLEHCLLILTLNFDSE